MFLKNKIFFLIFLFIISCEPIEFISPIEFDNSRLEKISVNASNIKINLRYNSIFSEENIEDQISNTPLQVLENWITNNINVFGDKNLLIINIIDASILKREIENKDAKKYEEKTIFLYEIFYLVEYELYDNNNFLLANTTVESTRSTTSQKYISLNETELIINDLLNKAVNDFVEETKSLFKTYMAEYVK